LRELGRSVRTLFALDWMQNVELRRRVQIGLNKGEAKNALARAVFLNRSVKSVTAVSKTSATAPAASTCWLRQSFCGTPSTWNGQSRRCATRARTSTSGCYRIFRRWAGSTST
jgi:hypothetical protein